MTVAIYLPLLLGLPLGWSARWIAGRGRPATTARCLTLVAVIAAFSSTWSLVLLALTVLDDLPPLSALGDRSSLRLPEPVPDPVALVAGVLLLGAGWRLLADLRRRVGTVRGLRAIGSPADGLVVADWSAPMAVAVPGRAGVAGHLLVTTGMLRLLDPAERRVVFAHERAHLRHRHHLLVTAVAAAAAVNPLLTGVREAVTFLVERWADEEAATAVGDRRLAARAVARAALAAATGLGAAVALGIGGGAAVHRVLALGEPAPPHRRRRLLGPATLAAGYVAAVAVATAEFVTLARAWL